MLWWMFDQPRVTMLHGDCVELMAAMPEGSADLIVADPPYGVGVTHQENGKSIACKWDKIEDYDRFTRAWIAQAVRVLSDAGVMYVWHNGIKAVGQIIQAAEEAGMELVSFCVWDKGRAYRAQQWKNRKQDGKNVLRSWFSRCEYALHFAKMGSGRKNATGLERINSNAACYRPLKDWYAGELDRLGITVRDIGARYTAVTGRKPYMLRHYFQDSQFEIPTRQVWESVYMPLGFQRSYEALRAEYEALRYPHNVDAEHCNVWQVPPVPNHKDRHTCEKPQQILRRIIRVSSRPGAVVLDPFAGGGSTGIAALAEGRDFVGVEKDDHWFAVASEAIARAAQARQTTMWE